MIFDYEQNVWGKEEATLSFVSPTYFRLKKALKILKKTSTGEKVLDFGCGVGRFARAFRNQRPDLEIYGCDISERAILKAKGERDGVIYDRIESDKIVCYPEEFFENIFVFDVLEHAENPEAVLTELKRILKNDGSIFLQVPCEGDFLSLWFWLDKIGLKKDLTKKFAGHVNFWSRKNLLILLKKCGFKVEKLYYGDHLLGQMAGVLAFYLTSMQARKKGTTVYNNETCMSELKESRGMGWSALGKTANFFINLEDLVWQKFPSANVFCVLKKKLD
ncbi:MAG TPA: class I SAM-dependent methyltransferase [Candidatus Magasanikbacteria bacterium]|nr:class I SAM-dependent methyltransferase [Candidatus Magasanikbacteria bacterium]